jgi:hypothetical protein
MMPCCPEITRHHHISSPPQIEISFFLAAPASALVRGSLGISGGYRADDAVEAAEEGLGQAGWKHDFSLGSRIDRRSDVVTTKGCG